MGLGMSTTKQTERGTDFTDHPIVTRSLLVFSKVFHFYYFFDRTGESNPQPSVPEAETPTTQLFGMGKGDFSYFGKVKVIF